MSFRLCVLVTCCLASAQSCSLLPSLLTVDYLAGSPASPRITDSAAPLLSWALALAPGAGNASAANLTQASYRIAVASSPSLLDSPDLWDSGVVASRASVALPFGGAALPARARAYWRVAVVDSAGGACAPAASPVSAWEVPLLAEADWRGARWITRSAPHAPAADCEYYNDSPSPLLRAAFALAQPPSAVARASLYVAGLGYFTPFLDGQQVGDEALAPGWSDFNKTLAYSSFDVTAVLRSGGGAHVLGIALGNGWFNLAPLRFWGHAEFRQALPTGDPQARALLAVDFADGSSQSVVTAPGAAGGWAAGGSEVLFNSIYLGVRVNRTLEPVGWCTTAFDASSWPAPFAPPGGDGGVGALRASRVPPVRRQAPVPLAELPRPAGANASTRVFDLGRQVAGVCEWRWRAAGRGGAAVHFLFGELLHADGSVNGLTSVAGQIKSGDGGPCAPAVAYQTDTYVLRGDDDERWAPPFTWHAGRYVQVTAADAGTAAALDAAASVCFPLRSDVDIVGSFASSSALLNAVHAADVNTYECNTMSVQSDCPARERLGYGGDVLMSHEAVSLNLDTALLYEKRVDDFIAAQRPNGGFTETAPFVGLSDAGLGGGSGPIGWQTVVPVLAAFLLARDGNAPLAARALPAVARYADLLGDPASARAIENGLGDWMTLEPAAVALTGRGFELLSFAGAADLADASGNASAAAAYRAAAAAAASYINAQFLDATTGVYAKAGQFNNTQCGQAMPLYLGIVPPAVAPAALAALESNLDAHGGHLQVGGFGVKWLLMALSDAGRADLAWRIMNQTTFPSHGYMLDVKVNNLTSATTIWESWFTSDNTYSHNHAMFSSGEVWMYQGLAGIKMAAPTWAAVRIAPAPPPPGHGLDAVNASIATPRGRISSEWTLAADGAFALTVCVPPNVRVAVRLPGAAADVDAGTCCGCVFHGTVAAR